ncbi:MAG: hypothetical protein JEZ06_24775 [Anaerolineaceae bacterium]|nr:hypothetical protein [Anaerolineaceae bacterium]
MNHRNPKRPHFGRRRPSFKNRGFQGRGRQPHPKLIRANQLFSQGEYLRAAGLYEELAMMAERRQSPRSPRAFLQTGRALILGGKTEAGFGKIQHAFHLLHNHHRKQEIIRLLPIADNELSENGMDHQSKILREWANNNGYELFELLDKNDNMEIETQKDNRILPDTCNRCGAIIHPKEIEWVDSITAECSYCGTLVRIIEK